MLGMVVLDDDRLRYPTEYFQITGATLSNFKEEGGFVDFTITTDEGFSINARGSSHLMKGAKEGKMKEGYIEGIINFRMNGKNLSEARPYFTVESWVDVKVDTV